MTKPCFVGIDTSNYTTSLSFCTEEGEVIANLKKPLSVKEGERGLRQSDAVFLHTKNLPLLFEEARPLFEEYTPLAVGVSAYPRTQKGSYMPCFLAGVSVAKGIAVALGVPLFEFSHQNGHIMAALYSSGAVDAVLGKEFLAFHVSGGTTEVLHVKPNGKDFLCEVIGGASDLHAGQVIDRIGVAMGLSFPCGPAMERLAISDAEKPIRKGISVREGFCNLSGLENMASTLYLQTKDAPLTAAFVLDYIGNALLRLCEGYRTRFGERPFLFAGGVMSNAQIKAKITARYAASFAAPALSSDNAVGIAALAALAHQKEGGKGWT